MIIYQDSKIQEICTSLSTKNLAWIVSPFDFADSVEELDFTACERDVIN